MSVSLTTPSDLATTFYRAAFPTRSTHRVCSVSSGRLFRPAPVCGKSSLENPLVPSATGTREAQRGARPSVPKRCQAHPPLAQHNKPQTLCTDRPSYWRMTATSVECRRAAAGDLPRGPPHGARMREERYHGLIPLTDLDSFYTLRDLRCVRRRTHGKGREAGLHTRPSHSSQSCSPDKIWRWSPK